MKPLSSIPASLGRLVKDRLIIQQPGAILDGYDLTGFYVSVIADNVLIKDCKLGSNGYFTIDQQSGSGLIVQGCALDTGHDSGQQMAFINGRDGTLFVRNCSFSGAGSDGVLISRGVIEGCHFIDPWGRKGSHSDAITVSKTTGPVVIRGNTIDWRALPGTPGGPNNCIRIAATKDAVVRDVTVEGNTLIGGTYPICASLDPTANAASRCERITIRDNVISEWGKNMGWLYPSKRATDLVCVGNKTPDGLALAA